MLPQRTNQVDLRVVTKDYNIDILSEKEMLTGLTPTADENDGEVEMMRESQTRRSSIQVSFEREE